MQAFRNTSFRLMKSVRLMLITVAAVLITSIFSISMLYAECLTIASNPKKLKLVDAIQKDVKQLFERTGICASYINFPLKRMQIKIRLGEIDGEFLRIRKYINAMKEYVIPVPTPLISVTGLLVTRSAGSHKPKTISDIIPLRVGIMHGTVWQQNAVKGNRKIAKAYSYLDLAEKLKKDEIEVFLIEELALTALVKSGKLKASDIYISPVVVDHPTYLLMHKKHENLIGKLDKILRKMKSEGRFQIEKCCK